MAHHQIEIKKFTPPNFLNSKYKTAKLTKLQWHDEFMARLTVLKMIKAEDLKSATDLNKSHIDSGVDWKGWVKENTDSAETRIANQVEGVYGLDGEVFILPKDISSDDEPEYMKYMRYPNSPKEERTFGIDRQIFTLSDEDMLTKLSVQTKSSHVFATVNLDAPDNILNKHFKLWLGDERERAKQRGLSFGNKKSTSNRVNEISPSVMNDWHNARVLQYADVLQWNQLRNQKISDESAHMIIFPDDVTDEKIRRTTRPIYEQFCIEEDLMKFHPMSS